MRFGKTWLLLRLILKVHVALVAQGIEHRIPNPGVARSIRAEGTNKNKGLSPFFMRFVPLDIAFSCFLIVLFDIKVEQKWNKKLRDLRYGTHSNSQRKK